ncbi:MAG: hypothetical protein M3R60_02940 [Pseudomonadota bacterium]|nr:hypothetical protein [Pseudomonadota bacterium]
MPLSHTAYLRVVRASAWYDLVVTAPFFTPWTFAIALGQLSALNRQLGGAPLPAFDPFHTLFACLMGSIVLIWTLLRLRAPSVTLGRYDGAGRLLFSLWMAWALAATGAPLLWLFVVPEFAWGALQWLPVARPAAREAR